MPTLLHLDSSADLVHSRTRALTAHFAETWRAAGPNHLVTRRDLHRDALPHLPDAALHWPPRLRPADAHPSAAAETLQRELIEELVDSDVLLVGAPLYNYSVPSTLKAWLDHIHVPGVTTPFDDTTQPMAGRQAVIVTSQGALYDPGTPRAGWDHAVPLLEILLGEALGMTLTVVTVPLALVDVAPPLAQFRERAEVEYAAAFDTLAAVAAELGAR